MIVDADVLKPNKLGFNHICFAVDDLEADIAKLTAAGVHPTKRADVSRHGYRAAQFEDAFARFLPHEPNIRTLKRGREGM